MEPITCSKCNKKFTYDLYGMGYPGAKDKEDIDCPYCGHNYRTIMTYKSVYTTKLDDNGKPID